MSKPEGDDTSDNPSKERELVRRLQEGDTGAFDELYAMHASIVLMHIGYRGLTRPEAEDVAQETWFRALADIRRFQDQGRGLRVWLLGIATRVIKERSRKQLRIEPGDKEPPDPVDPTPSVVDSMVTEEVIVAIRRELEKAPPDYKELIEARFLCDFHTDQIMELYGWSSQKVHLTTHRVVKWLKSRLERADGPR